MKITANGISMNYSLEGRDGVPVVTLSHSLATNLSMWDPQVPALVSRYRVLRYDTRGHGGTDAPQGPYPLHPLAEARPGGESRTRVPRTQGMEPHVEPTPSRWFTTPFRERRPDVVDPVRAMIR